MKKTIGILYILILFLSNTYAQPPQVIRLARKYAIHLYQVDYEKNRQRSCAVKDGSSPYVRAFFPINRADVFYVENQKEFEYYEIREDQLFLQWSAHLTTDSKAVLTDVNSFTNYLNMNFAFPDSLGFVQCGTLPDYKGVLEYFGYYLKGPGSDDFAAFQGRIDAGGYGLCAVNLGDSVEPKDTYLFGLANCSEASNK